MKKTVLYFCCVIVGVLIGFVLSKNISLDHSKYYILENDYRDDSGSTIKKGTKLKFDKGYSEGFSRYILYINIEDFEEPEKQDLKSNNYNEIIPYWFEKDINNTK
mgnify:CR=1 FL=1